jgi:uncharacterized protein (TIGR03083 family)
MTARADRPWPDPDAFLADERASFLPFEAILELDEADLDLGPTAHGWTARDVLAHLVGWHEVAAEVANELQRGPTSPRKVVADAEWEQRGDEINAEINAAWRALDLPGFRARARRATATLRTALRQTPVERWWDSDEYFAYFLSEMQEHYNDHLVDLAIVLGSGAADRSDG